MTSKNSVDWIPVEFTLFSLLYPLHLPLTHFSRLSSQALSLPLALHLTSSLSSFWSENQSDVGWAVHIKGLPAPVHFCHYSLYSTDDNLQLSSFWFSSSVPASSQKNECRDHVGLIQCFILVWAIDELSHPWRDPFKTHLQSYLLLHDSCLGQNWFLLPQCPHHSSPHGHFQYNSHKVRL